MCLWQYLVILHHSLLHFQHFKPFFSCSTTENKTLALLNANIKNLCISKARQLLGKSDYYLVLNPCQRGNLWLKQELWENGHRKLKKPWWVDLKPQIGMHFANHMVTASLSVWTTWFPSEYIGASPITNPEGNAKQQTLKNWLLNLLYICFFFFKYNKTDRLTRLNLSHFRIDLYICATEVTIRM